MSVVVCSENRRADWDELIAQCADATSGHLWQWREVVGSAYGFDAFYLLAQDGRGRPIAAAPFIFVRSFLYGSELASMPYIDYGGVCHADWLDSAGRDAAQAELIAQARELAAKLRAKRLHIRSLHQFGAPFEVSTEKVAQHLALASTVDEQLRRLPSERRNRLKRVEKLKLSMDVSDPTDPAALADLCAVYSENMRDLGSPTHGRRFFSQLVSGLRDRLSLIRVRSGGRVVAAGLAMNFHGWMTLPWTAPRPRRVRYTPPTLCTGRGYGLVSSPVATPSISGGQPWAQASSNSSANGARLRCSRIGARCTFRRGLRRRAIARACKPSAVCGVTCRWEWPARWDRGCDGGSQIEFIGGTAIWYREGGGRALAHAAPGVSLDRRDSHSRTDSA